MGNSNRLPPERPTSKDSFLAIRWIAFGSAVMCGLAISLGTYPRRSLDRRLGVLRHLGRRSRHSEKAVK